LFLFLAPLFALVFSAVAANAQLPVPPSAPPPPPGQGAAAPAPGQKQEGYSIRRTVNLVVLHTSVLDDRGRFVDGLKEENFRVLEDKVQQKLSVFKREDIPVSMGLIIDNSGSMRDKRPRVNEAAITLVQTSNPEDEAFVVNFNDDFYLDLDKDFTNSIPDLKEGTKDKKVLLVVTDGEDNASRNSLEKTVHEIQQTDVVIYTIGLLGQESKKTAKRARKALKEIAEASGGLAFFPENVADVHSICEDVAHDIRNQYTLAYYPSNTKRDGTFRAVQVEVIPPRGHGKLSARTRNGYYAPGGSASGGSAASGSPAVGSSGN
jgi:Ca-activated chloride channel family protein